MRDLTSPGVAGALIGLALGLVEYFLAMMMIRRFVAREIEVARKENEPLPGMPMLPGTMRTMQIVLIIAAVTIYPVVGYVVGNMLAS
jgi:hypothetical protein